MKFNGYVCDRCGSLVAMDQPNPEKMEISMFVTTDRENENLKIRSVFKDNHAEIISGQYGSRLRLSKDLCYNCTKELFNWFGGKPAVNLDAHKGYSLIQSEMKKEEEEKPLTRMTGLTKTQMEYLREAAEKEKKEAAEKEKKEGMRVPNGTLEKKYTIGAPKNTVTNDENGCLVEDFLDDILKKYWPSKKVTKKDGKSYDVAKHHRTLLYNWAKKNFRTIEEIMKCTCVEDTEYKRPMNNQMLYDLKSFLKKEGF